MKIKHLQRKRGILKDKTIGVASDSRMYSSCKIEYLPSAILLRSLNFLNKATDLS